MVDTLGNGPKRGYGNFDLLRVLAGLALIYGNGLILTGGPPSALWAAPGSRFGIDMMFAISGFLVAGSWLARPGAVGFAARRMLRIWPGLAVCVLVTVAVIGPLGTHMPEAAYARHGMTHDYLKNMVFIERLWLPDTFRGQPWVGTVNPMLWTLGPGLLASLALPALGLLPERLRVSTLVTAAAICGLAAFAWPARAQVLIELPFFLMGAAWRVHSGRRDGVFRADLAMLLFAGNWVVATWLDRWNIVLEWVSLPYMLACFGRMTAPGIGKFGRWGNPAYGLFLYAFPVQQLIVARWPDCPHPILLCAAISLVAGYASWHLVERPVLDWAARPMRRLAAAMP